MKDSELNARILLNVALPANEGRLRKLLFDLPAEEALKFVLQSKPDQRWLDMALNRARARLRAFDLSTAMKTVEDLKLVIIHPSTIQGLQQLESQSPWIVFGTAELPEAKFTAVVGTRSQSERGRSIAKHIASEVEGLVSGGAVGIDLEAHKQAKLESKPQIMVLAGGLDRVYPKQATEFIQAGFIGTAISEMPPGVSSGKLGYLNRNRLIAAICERLYLIEAPMVSGSINTAQHALSLKKEVTVCVSNDPEFSPGGLWFAKKPGVGTELFDELAIR